MMKYYLVRSKTGAILFAKGCDIISHIHIDSSIIDPAQVLSVMKDNQVAPKHLQNVYDDLIADFAKIK